jgi:hypothetical protein
MVDSSSERESESAGRERANVFEPKARAVQTQKTYDMTGSSVSHQVRRSASIELHFQSSQSWE